MRLHVQNFCSIGLAELQLQRGISLLAGRNGAGKTQFLLAVSAGVAKEHHTLYQNGVAPESVGTAVIATDSRNVLYRPSLRRNGEGSRNVPYATLALSEWNKSNGAGYRWGIDERFTRLHDRLAKLYVAADPRHASTEDSARWRTVCNSFRAAFDRELVASGSAEGLKIGLELAGGGLCAFALLSTGELEFLALICDLLTAGDVDLFLTDELDVHFHADLQRKVIEVIEPLVADRYFLVSTHSPIAMLSVAPDRVYFMRSQSEVPVGTNQIARLSDDVALFSRIADLYPGFVEDARLSQRLQAAGNANICAYAAECLRPGEATSPRADSDPQNSALRGTVLQLAGEPTVVDVGAGNGGLLSAFRTLDDATARRFAYHAVDVDAVALARLRDWAIKDGVVARFRACDFHQDVPDVQADLVLAANVVHEVGPENLASFLTQLLRATKAGGSLLIFEVRELRVGEERFVLFDDADLRMLFQRLLNRGAVEIASSHPLSYKGVPLLEFHVRVRQTDLAVEPADVATALDGVVDRCAQTLGRHIGKAEQLSALQLAFVSHNLANAAAFRRRLAI